MSSASGLLEQDFTTVPGQQFALISLVGPDLPQKNDKFGLKIRGVFASKDEAASYAKRLQKEDATFDIYLVDMYKWLLIPPDRDHIDDVNYADEKLQEIMTKYKENQRQATIMFEKRKRDMMANNIDPGDENSKFYSRPDEPPISHPAEIVERLRKEKPEASIEELVKEANDIIEKEMAERQKWRAGTTGDAAGPSGTSEASGSNVA
jgi:hypothetical protein